MSRVRILPALLCRLLQYEQKDENEMLEQIGEDLVKAAGVVIVIVAIAALGIGFLIGKVF
jgi:hypothetical protein